MIFRKISPSRLEAYASPLVVVGAAAILAVVVVVLAVHNINRETRLASTILTEKGAVLVRSFEAGARAGMMGMLDPRQRMGVLAEQFAMLPGIEDIVLTDMQGVVRAGSDEQLLGQPFLPAETFEELAPSEKLQWKVMDSPDGGRSFLVYKIFTPLRYSDQAGAHDHRTRRGRMAQRMRRNWHSFCEMMGPPGEDGRPCPADEEQAGERPPMSVLFVGMDVTPFEEARAQDLRTTVLLAATLLALGLGGVIALYWAQRLRASRRLLQDTRAFAGEIIAHMPMGLVAMDPDGRITMVNATAHAVLGGVCKLQQGGASDVCLPPELTTVLERVRSGEEIVEHEVQLDAGSETPLSIAVSGARIEAEEGRSVGAILLLRDLRELKRLEEAVRRAEKLAAIGSLAAGVAHEIRNPLSSIKAAATYFGQQFDEGSDAARMSEIMIQEVERLNRAVTQLLEYARPSQLAIREVDLPELVRRSLELVRQDAQAKGISVEVDLDSAPPVARLDPDRVTQALLNLYVNAIQAMEEGGELAVSAEAVEGGGVRFSVADTGPGLPPGDARRVFDPYVTTKARGAGLGLAIVQKIVEAHQGEVDVRSTPGVGATFSMTLPLEPKIAESGEIGDSEET